MRYFFISGRLTWRPDGRKMENAPGSWGLAAISFNLTLSGCLLMIVTAILARATHTLSCWHFLTSSSPFQINTFIDKSHLLHLASRHRAGRGSVQRDFLGSIGPLDIWRWVWLGIKQDGTGGRNQVIQRALLSPHPSSHPRPSPHLLQTIQAAGVLALEAPQLWQAKAYFVVVIPSPG